MQVAACFRLVSPLDSQEQEQEEQEDAKRVPDCHDRSFGSWPWQKKEVKERQGRKVGSALFKRPGVAGAVLLTPLSLIY